MEALSEERMNAFIEDVRELLEQNVHPEMICTRLHVTLAAAERRLRRAAPDLAGPFARARAAQRWWVSP